MGTSQLSRRALLTRGAGYAIALSGGAVFLKACATDPATTPAGTGTSPAPGETIVLKAATGVAGAYPYTDGLEDFKQRLEEATDGRIEVQIFTDSALGGERDLFEGLGLGTVEAAVGVTGVLASYTSHIQIMDMPFLFQDMDHGMKVMTGPIGKELIAPLPDHGIRVLGFYEGGTRNLVNRLRPVTHPTDLNGMRIRIIENPVFIAAWEAAGATPTPMPAGEVYTALQQGTIDGADGSFTGIYTSSFYEVAQHGSLTDHALAIAVLAVSEQWFTSLPEDLQDAVATAAEESQETQRAAMRRAEEENKASAESEGVTWSEIDREAFRERMEPVWDRFADDVGGRERIQEVIDAV